MSADERVELTVVGSINLDFTVRLERLPRPGETVSAHQFVRGPGGKGANQAVAAARLGAAVTIVGAVGDDELADEAHEIVRNLLEDDIREIKLLQEHLHDGLGQLVYDRTRRRPMILPVVVEV